jgi:hypothetical protein
MSELSTLTADERTALADCEETIERGRVVFLEVGQALLTIRDRRLYRETHPTFEAYCRDRWRITASAAYQKIDVARVSTVVEISNARQARELAPLLREPDRLRRVYDRAAEQAGGQPTAQQLRAERVRVQFAEPADAPPPSPTGVSRGDRVTAHIVKRLLLGNLEQLRPLVGLLSAEDREALARELRAFSRLLDRAS